MNSKTTLKKLLGYIDRYKYYLLLSLIFAVVSVALTLYAPILIGNAIDCIVGKGDVDFSRIIDILIRLVIVISCTAVVQWLMNVCNNKIVYNVSRDMRQRAFVKIESLPCSYLDTHSKGDIVSRVINDVDQLSDGLLMGFTQLFTGVVTIVGTIGFMLSINVWITLVVVVVTPMSFFIAKFISTRTYKMFMLQSKARGEQTAFVDEMVSNQKVADAYNMNDINLKRFDEINERYADYSLKSTFYSSLTNPSTRFVNNIVYAAVALFGAFLAINGNITVGILSSFLAYAKQYAKPFNEITSVITEMQNALACAGRVFSLIEEESVTPDSDDALQLTNVRGDVEIRGLAFSYLPDKPLITNLNLKVPRGTTVAIVGPTGCGKTTLINLLMRFYDPDCGKIMFDGVDTREITRKSLRSNIGMVLQDTWLKSATIADNIRLADRNATDEQVVKAAKAAHAHSFIKRLPNGYDTFIGEDGGSLSQGQKQLLCITRLMLSPPPVLILDEATSSIDTRTEIRIQKAFDRLMQGRTTFIVAHRLSTIRNADIILVMNDGDIVEQGNHKDLLAKKGFYYTLYNSQFPNEEFCKKQ